MKKKKPEVINLLKNFEMASGLGFSIAIPISLGTIIGAFLDVKTGSRPLFTLVFLFLGLTASIYTGYKIVKKNLIPPKSAS